MMLMTVVLMSLMAAASLERKPRISANWSKLRSTIVMMTLRVMIIMKIFISIQT